MIWDYRAAKPAGSLAICPAGADYLADADGTIEAILVAIEPGQFALVLRFGTEAQLIERLQGYDQALLNIAPLGV